MTKYLVESDKTPGVVAMFDSYTEAVRAAKERCQNHGRQWIYEQSVFTRRVARVEMTPQVFGIGTGT